MRLSELEITSIKSIINGFDPNAVIYLFGSRVNDTKKGGDIDLLVISDAINFDDTLKIKLGLYDKIGEQKIDLLVEADTSKPFTQIAVKEGIQL